MPLTVEAKNSITNVLRVRDASLAAVQPPLDHIPPESERPTNVTGIAQRVLTSSELEITELNAPELVRRMSTKELLCETVTKAFLRRAALAQELVSDTLRQP